MLLLKSSPRVSSHVVVVVCEHLNIGYLTDFISDLISVLCKVRFVHCTCLSNICCDSSQMMCSELGAVYSDVENYFNYFSDFFD